MRTMAVHSPSALLTCTLRLCNGHFVLLILWVLRVTNVKHVDWGSVLGKTTFHTRRFLERMLSQVCSNAFSEGYFYVALFWRFHVLTYFAYLAYVVPNPLYLIPHMLMMKKQRRLYRAVKYQSNTSFFSCLKLKLGWIMASKFFFVDLFSHIGKYDKFTVKIFCTFMKKSEVYVINRREN